MNKVHLIEKVMGQWYIWPYDGERQNNVRVLRTNEAIAGPFSTRTQALTTAVGLVADAD